MSNMYSNNVTRVRVEYASEISNGLRCYIQDTIRLTFLGWPVLTKYLNAQTQNYPLDGSQFSAYQILLVRKSCNKKLRWRHLVLKMSTSFVFDFAREKSTPVRDILSSKIFLDCFQRMIDSTLMLKIKDPH